MFVRVLRSCGLNTLKNAGWWHIILRSKDGALLEAERIRHPAQEQDLEFWDSRTVYRTNVPVFSETYRSEASAIFLRRDILVKPKEVVGIVM